MVIRLSHELDWAKGKSRVEEKRTEDDSKRSRGGGNENRAVNGLMNGKGELK